MSRSARILALLAAAALIGGRLQAQVLGLPVRNAGVSTGLTVAADVGFPSGDAGKGWAVGASGALGLGPLGFTGAIARWDPKAGASLTSAGATANLKIFGGPLVPLSITAQAGAAYASQEASGVPSGGTYADTRIKYWHVPIGVGIALTIPNPVLAIRPWIAPRVDIARISYPDALATPDDTETNFGLSAGVDFNLLNGIGIRAMYDRVSAGGGANPSVISLGLSYGLRVGR